MPDDSRQERPSHAQRFAEHIESWLKEGEDETTADDVRQRVRTAAQHPIDEDDPIWSVLLATGIYHDISRRKLIELLKLTAQFFIGLMDELDENFRKYDQTRVEQRLAEIEQQLKEREVEMESMADSPVESNLLVPNNATNDGKQPIYNSDNIPYEQSSTTPMDKWDFALKLLLGCVGISVLLATGMYFATALGWFTPGG